jgi:hypothetical protein
LVAEKVGAVFDSWRGLEPRPPVGNLTLNFHEETLEMIKWTLKKTPKWLQETTLLITKVSFFVFLCWQNIHYIPSFNTFSTFHICRKKEFFDK